MLLFRSLASGSSGNAYLLQTGKATLLFDAGLRMPKLRMFLAGEGIEPEELTAVLLSHEHTDHCLAARDLAVEHGVPVLSNEKVLRACGLVDLNQSSIIEVGRPLVFGDIEVNCFGVSHDAVCPVGFLVRTSSRTVAIATDLGQSCSGVTEAVGLADLVVLESNHDLGMLHGGRYPTYLRRRVSGPKGHLSNDQAGEILAKHVKGEHVDIWLAHLSKENNTPGIAARTVRRALEHVGFSSPSVSVASRDRPSLRWNGTLRPRQLSLFSGLESI